MGNRFRFEDGQGIPFAALHSTSATTDMIYEKLCDKLTGASSETSLYGQSADSIASSVIRVNKSTIKLWHWFPLALAVTDGAHSIFTNVGDADSYVSFIINDSSSLSPVTASKCHNDHEAAAVKRDSL